MLSENKSSENEHCALCNGSGRNFFGYECTYCNGTGEYNKVAENYLKNHICQCINSDRKNCPVCHKKCHHDTPFRPKLLAGGGYEQ